MQIHLDFVYPTSSPDAAELIEAAARTALKQQRAPEDVEISVVVSDDEQLRSLNQQFRGVDAPTDVLSFPMNYTDPESGVVYLGDVVISYPRAEAQARAGGHAVEAELQLLTVHGVLHLMGHDHAEPVEKERMWQAQAEILTALGIPDIYIPE